MKKHKNKFIAAAVIAAILAVAWFWGGVPIINMPTPEEPPPSVAAAVEEADYPGDAPQEQSNLADVLNISDEAEADITTEYAPYDYNDSTDEAPEDIPDALYYEDEYTDDNDIPDEQYVPEDVQQVADSVFDIVPEVANPERFGVTPEGVVLPTIDPADMQTFATYHPAMRAPVEPEDMEIGDGYFTVTLSVRAHTILYNMHLLHRDKHELVPDDGWILPPTEVIAFEGESVFNVLQREMRRNRIHMVARWTPIFNSAYVEAINNLYEFDVGSLSGWMYRVNGWFPNFGASRYLLSPGDVIEWIYTVDLGRDLGVHWLGGE